MQKMMQAIGSIRPKLLEGVIISILCCLSAYTNANVLQYYAGISYSNPAELFKTNKNIFLIGGTGFYGDVRFSGSALNLNTFQYDSGVSASRRFSLLPYGRIATRVNDKLVLGIDVTQPFHSNLIWGRNAFTRYASTDTLMTDVDFSPRFALSLAQNLNLGAGINFNFLKNNEVDWALPSSPSTYDTLVNRTSGLGLGWNAGMYYMFNKQNFLGITYYSEIRQRTQGVSFFNTNVSTDLRFDFSMPATTILNYVHIFNPKYLLSAQLFCSQWNVNQYARVQNTAAPPPVGPNFTFVMKYDPAVAFSTAVHYQYNDNLGLTLLGLVDDGPEQDHLRTINFPSDMQFFLGLGADYHLSKAAIMELLYGHVFSHTTIGNFIPINGQATPFTIGGVHINAEVFDLRFKYQL